MAEALLDLEIARLRRDLRAVLARGGDVLFSALARLRETRDRDGRARARPAGVARRRATTRTRCTRCASACAAALRGGGAGLLKGVRSDAIRLLKDLQERLGTRARRVRAGGVARGAGESGSARPAAPLAREARALGREVPRDERPPSSRPAGDAAGPTSCGTRWRRWDIGRTAA
jgi:hypothetical protein